MMRDPSAPLGACLPTWIQVALDTTDETEAGFERIRYETKTRTDAPVCFGDTIDGTSAGLDVQVKGMQESCPLPSQNLGTRMKSVLVSALALTLDSERLQSRIDALVSYGRDREHHTHHGCALLVVEVRRGLVQFHAELCSWQQKAAAQIEAFLFMWRWLKT